MITTMTGAASELPSVSLDATCDADTLLTDAAHAAAATVFYYRQRQERGSYFFPHSLSSSIGLRD